MPKNNLAPLFLFSLILIQSCILKKDSPIESSSNDGNLIQTGDIVVSNAGNDSIVLLHSDGTYKAVLYDIPTTSTVLFNGLAWDSLNKVLLFNYDSTTATFDEVKSIAPFDGAVKTVISNSNLNGTLPGIARLTGGELLVIEGTNAIEMFLADGTRSGNPFLTGLNATMADVTKLSNGGFVACSSSTANTVRTYDVAGVVQATATSSNPVNATNPTLGAIASTSCTQDATGRIIVAYSGATDAVRVYDSAMSAPIWTFIDTNVLTTPGKLAIRANGNILVTDTGFHHIVEISSTGALVQVIGGAVLSTPNNIVVVP